MTASENDLPLSENVQGGLLYIPALPILNYEAVFYLYSITSISL